MDLKGEAWWNYRRKKEEKIKARENEVFEK